MDGSVEVVDSFSGVVTCTGRRGGGYYSKSSFNSRVIDSQKERRHVPPCLKR